MASIFARLGFNYPEASGNDIITFDSATTDSLNALPKFADTWQYDAVANSQTTGYTQNPVQAITNTIISTAQSILSNTILASGLSTINTAANNIIYEGASFRSHTNRLSGTEEMTANTASLPTLDSALASGKSLVYIINQYEGVNNNAPIMGSFTSILIGDTLANSYSNIKDYSANIASSLTYDPIGMTYTSNLSAETITTMTNELTSIYNLFVTRRTHDENFYANSQIVLSDFKRMQRYTLSNMGETETNLYTNYIGSDNLKTHITPNEQTVDNTDYSIYEITSNTA